MRERSKAWCRMPRMYGVTANTDTSNSPAMGADGENECFACVFILYYDVLLAALD
jgi:hypothetical protein